MIQIPADYNYPSEAAVKAAAAVSPWIARGLMIFVTIIVSVVIVVYLKKKQV